MSDFDRRQPGESEASLNVAAWHLQVLLAALAALDSKIMFVTALNVAALSALIGVAVTADPIDWLLWLGFGTAILGATIGLARLWSEESGQFPSPSDAFLTAVEIQRLGATDNPDRIESRENFYAIWRVSLSLSKDLRQRLLLLRVLLSTTVVALAITVATTLTALI